MVKIKKILNSENIKNHPVVIKTNNGTIHEMSLFEASRWFSLISCVDIIGKKLERDGIDPNETNNWLKPIYFQKYIDDTYIENMFNILDKEVCTTL